MKYYADMRTKFGFDDGDDVPVEAWDLRDLYVRFMNDLAVKRGSAVRAYAYDHPGLHNTCQILYRDLAGDDVEEPDEIMENIILALENVDFMQFLRVYIRTNETLLNWFIETMT